MSSVNFFFFLSGIILFLFLMTCQVLVWKFLANCNSSTSSIDTVNTIWLEIQDSRLSIQDLRFRSKSMKMRLKIKVPDFRKSKYVSTIVLLQSFYFIQIFALSNAGASHENSVSVACCTFGLLEIRPLTQNANRLKNQSSDTLNILVHNCNHQ